MADTSRRQRVERVLDRTIKPVVWIVALALLGQMAYEMYTGRLVDPIEDLTHRTGFVALAALMLTLAVTPVRRATGWNGAVNARRLLGLWAFAFALIHFGIYLFDQGVLLEGAAAWSYVVEDVAERPYVTVGFTALLLLVPLAVTSTKGWVRRLGGKRWQRLHRLVYVVAVAGLVHFFLAVKRDVRDPTLYALVFGTLFAARLIVGRARAGRAVASAAPARAAES